MLCDAMLCCVRYVYPRLEQFARNHSFTALQAAAGKGRGVAKLAAGQDSSSLSKEAVDAVHQASALNKHSGAIEAKVGYRGWKNLGKALTEADYRMGEMVPMVTIDEVIATRHAQGGTRSVAMLKIDVQGFEVDV